jgi:hypothetical protein
MEMRAGFVRDKRLNRCKKIENAMYGGIYIGSPGRDIYYMLPYLSDEQMNEVVIKLSEKFPETPPKTYANVAACIRFIYGQFEKQGSLRSEKDFERMKKEKLDWELSRKFLKLLKGKFKKNNNFYGLSMLCEMEAHRLGDEAILNKDKDKLEEMERIYNKSVKYAQKCKSCKHMFSIYYWAAEYFKKFPEKKKAVEYYKLSIVNANKYYRKYFFEGDQYYSSRLLNSLSYICKKDKKDGKMFKDKYIKHVKNKFKN